MSEDDLKQSVVGKSLEWLLAGGGLLLLLVAIGFITEHSYQERLGVRIGNANSVAGYVAVAGEYLLFLFLAVFRWILANVLVGLVLAVVLVLAAKGLKVVWKQPTARRLAFIFGTFMVAYIADIVFLDAPALQVEDALVLGVERGHSFNLDSVVGGRAYRLWLHDVCSRLSQPEQRTVSEAFGLGACNSDRDWHYERIEQYFVASQLGASLLAMLAVWLAAFLSRLEMKRLFILPRLPVAVILLALGGFQLVWMPYVYSKVSRPTILNEAIVRLELPGSEVAEHGFVLADSEEYVGLFHKKDRQIWIVPKSRITLVKIERRSDVLQFHYKSAVELSQAQIQAPL